MGKSSKASRSEAKDRRAVVEQMRREQQRAEKKRTYAIVGACAVVGLAIIGAGLYPVIQQNRAAAGDLETLGVPASQAGCDDPVTEPATGSANHRPEGERIFYDNAPPAFGPHYASTAPMSRKFYTADDRPELEYLVHNLEHGYNIVWYDETVAEDDEMLNQLRAISTKFPGASDPRNKFIVAPWTADDGKPFPDGKHVAISHWSVGGDAAEGTSNQRGVWTYCEKPSGEAVADFVEEYPYTDSPEPNAI
ncbi:MAG: hypothetical protein AVDCRST_MAG72-2580 [uncultured Nocardioidaceae bacterium]|uniref:DUF3105 domain-containing protein n=1 Tax=uncultured Nocardioidaceae bacterium TaxID=253824 RepID=A0A6J4MQS4_9ACTN|nr:MAG: hypothetical protein AVDCRST_MAG72-2580 [uncultured Nocardioidaceae bacterium]